VRYSDGKREYIVTDGANEYSISTPEHLHHGACIMAEGELIGEMRIVAKRVVSLEGEKADAVYRKVKGNILSSSNIADSPVLLKDPLTMKMSQKLRDAALTILVAKKLGRSAMLRFHGDADGIAGAFAITKILPCKAFQQNSAAYTVRDALRDIATIGQESRPLVIILDFGSGENCSEGLSLIKAAGIEFLVIDHHPIDPKTLGEREGADQPAYLVNPYLFADNVSKYTAGYLACEIAAMCGLPQERALELAKIACSGDKSDILGSDAADARKALVLDYLSAHISFGNNLDFYRNVMEKQDLFDSIAIQADETIEEAAGKAMAGMKRVKGKRLDISYFSLEGIAKRGEWPSSSKITTRIYDKLRAGNPRALFCIGYTDRSVIMRLNDEAVALGLSANSLAKSISASMGDFFEGGGGHAKAGAIRAKTGFSKDILNELVKLASSADAA
jgi:RecJ-like exonuclease